MTARNMIAITEENSCKTGAVHKWRCQLATVAEHLAAILEQLSPAGLAPSEERTYSSFLATFASLTEKALTAASLASIEPVS
ncbi:hypothetical protein LAL4801_05902 [Roseibium aggregatum]|uniref:Uncharacterized protein n=1 Tax=Roseibium aggregatum TaxID=187304 RepID=A0A0M6YF44_9HYPH|nr:hypothetical protein LAL4801_05902 [Roseibium aggregatum]